MEERDALTDERWAALLEQRATDPGAVAKAFAARTRRPLLTDGRLFIVAADHTARGMVAVGSDKHAMVDRRRLLARLLIALSHPGVDGVLASPDVMEELVLLGALEGKVATGTTNRGGLQGGVWELDDPMTAYDAASLAQSRLDGGKMLLRIAYDDRDTVRTLEYAAKAVTELAEHQLMAMVEPLPYHRDASGTAKLLEDEYQLTRAVGIAQALGTTSAHTWLKVPASANVAEVLSATTLPSLILGGSPGPDPEATYASWEVAMAVPVVRGLVVGRALLYPADGDVAGAIDRAARIVRP